MPQADRTKKLRRCSQDTQAVSWLMKDLCEPDDDSGRPLDNAILLCRSATNLFKRSVYLPHFAVVSDRLVSVRHHQLLSAHECVLHLALEMRRTIRAIAKAVRPLSTGDVLDSLLVRNGRDLASRDGVVLLHFPGPTVPADDGSQIDPVDAIARDQYPDWWDAPCTEFTRATLGDALWRIASGGRDRKEWEPTIVVVDDCRRVDGGGVFVSVSLDEQSLRDQCLEVLGEHSFGELRAHLERENYKAIDRFSPNRAQAFDTLVSPVPLLRYRPNTKVPGGPLDGPVPPGGFRWKGIDLAEIPKLPFRLLTLLWEHRPGGATLEQVRDAVWLDPNEVVDWETVRNHRRTLNALFERSGLPWLADRENDRLVLIRTEKTRR